MFSVYHLPDKGFRQKFRLSKQSSITLFQTRYQLHVQKKEITLLFILE